MRLIILVTFLLSHFVSIACKCPGEQPSVKEGIKSSDIVAVGTVLSKEAVLIPDSSQISLYPADVFSHRKYPFVHTIAKYRVLVEQTFKGETTSDTITIYTGLGGGDCGYPFIKGLQYTIYGSKNTVFGKVNNKFQYPVGPGIFWTNICTRTALFEEDEIGEIKEFID